MAKEASKSIVEHRIEVITKYGPNMIAIGQGGFKDYVVFGFTASKRYVLESPSLGNATYVFSNDWETLSALTKKQILDGSLHEARIIHNHKWALSMRSAIIASS